MSVCVYASSRRLVSQKIRAHIGRLYNVVVGTRCVMLLVCFWFDWSDSDWLMCIYEVRQVTSVADCVLQFIYCTTFRRNTQLYGAVHGDVWFPGWYLMERIDKERTIGDTRLWTRTASLAKGNAVCGLRSSVYMCSSVCCSENDFGYISPTNGLVRWNEVYQMIEHTPVVC